MKKILISLLVLLVAFLAMVFTLSGCGGKSSSDTSASTTATESKVTETASDAQDLASDIIVSALAEALKSDDVDAAITKAINSTTYVIYAIENDEGSLLTIDDFTKENPDLGASLQGMSISFKGDGTCVLSTVLSESTGKVEVSDSTITITDDADDSITTLVVSDKGTLALDCNGSNAYFIEQK
jgi:predicted RNA-binding protein (virulence factor B family)